MIVEMGSWDDDLGFDSDPDYIASLPNDDDEPTPNGYVRPTLVPEVMPPAVEKIVEKRGLTGAAAFSYAASLADRVRALDLVEDARYVVAARTVREGDLAPWAETDLEPVLADDDTGPVCTLLERSDGHMMLYPGRVNALLGESEVGKGWMALLGCAQTIRAERHVVYVDFEDDAFGVVSRLKLLGLGQKQIRTYFHYVRANDPVDDTARVALVNLAVAVEAALVVIDGVTEAMVSAGWSMLDNDDVARFYATLPRPLARTGAAVLLIDHIPKTADSKGAIGAQHKRAGMDGAAYRLEIMHEFGEGREGSVKIIVDKDRPGRVRSWSLHSKVAGMMVIKPREDGDGLDVFIIPITAGDANATDYHKIPKLSATEAALRILKAKAGTAMSGNKIKEAMVEANKAGTFAVKANNTDRNAAIAALPLDPESNVRTYRGKRGPLYVWSEGGPEREETPPTAPLVWDDDDGDDPYDPPGTFRA